MTLGYFVTIKFRRDSGIPCTDKLEGVTQEEAIHHATMDAHVYRDPIVYPCNWQGYRTGPDIVIA